MVRIAEADTVEEEEAASAAAERWPSGTEEGRRSALGRYG